MAGDWIKMRHDLADDPAVISLAETTACVDEQHVIGVLHKLWSWADRQTTDGYAAGVTTIWLGRYLGIDGFIKGLVRVGWLKCNTRGITIPKFDAHNTKSAKNRALASQRMSRKRHADSVTKSPPEKRRTEQSSFDRSIESNDRRMIDSIDWKEAKSLAVRLNDKIKAAWSQWTVPPTFRVKLLTACGLVQCGLMPEGTLADAVDSMLLARRRSPAGYLGKVLADTDDRWDVLQRAVTLPGKDGVT